MKTLLTLIMLAVMAGCSGDPDYAAVSMRAEATDEIAVAYKTVQPDDDQLSLYFEGCEVVHISVEEWSGASDEEVERISHLLAYGPTLMDPRWQDVTRLLRMFVPERFVQECAKAHQQITKEDRT